MNASVYTNEIWIFEHKQSTLGYLVKLYCKNIFEILFYYFETKADKARRNEKPFNALPSTKKSNIFVLFVVMAELASTIIFWNLR